MDRAQARELEKAENEWRKLKQVTFKCEPDAAKACDRFNIRCKYHQAQAQAASLSQYARRGRPAAQDEPEVVGYKIQGEIVVREPLIDEAKKSLGKFIIATNEQDPSRLSAKAMLAHYTAQGISVDGNCAKRFKRRMIVSRIRKASQLIPRPCAGYSRPLRGLMYS